MKVVKIALASGLLAVSVIAAPLAASASSTYGYSDQDKSCLATIGPERYQGICGQSSSH